MLRRRGWTVELLTALGLVAVPYVLPYLGFAPGTINQILIWGLFGIGFDILFGYTGLLSFGQSAFFGTGGFVAAYLLTNNLMSDVVLALVVGMVVAALVGCLVGMIALRRTGIYFAMITVAIAETFFFIENSPLSAWTGGENGIPGVPTPKFSFGGFSYQVGTGWSMYGFLAVCYFVGMVIALRIVRSPMGAVFSAIRDNPLRARAVGHAVGLYKLTAFVIASAYAGFAGGLLGVLQAFMPPEAFTFGTSGQLVMQTAIGGTGTLFGPLLGAAVWLLLRDFLQGALGLGSAWKLVLGLVFVLLVCFLRHGLIGGARDLIRRLSARRRPAPAAAPVAAAAPLASVGPSRRRQEKPFSGPVLEARGLSKSFGGLVANSNIDFAVAEGELRGVIGPNGAGKSTFFKMLTCELRAELGPHRLPRPRHHRHGRGRRVPAGTDQDLPDQPALLALDAAREHRHRRLGRAARQLRARPPAPRRSRAGPGDASGEHAGAGRPRGPRRRAGRRARLRREAAPGDRTGARHVALALAARRAARRHEPAWSAPRRCSF